MQSKTRNAFAKYLRQQGLKVSTSNDFLRFNNYSVIFKEDCDYVLVHNPYSKLARLDLPYTSPEVMLKKIRLYFSQVKPRN